VSEASVRRFSISVSFGVTRPEVLALPVIARALGKALRHGVNAASLPRHPTTGDPAFYLEAVKSSDPSIYTGGLASLERITVVFDVCICEGFSLGDRVCLCLPVRVPLPVSFDNGGPIPRLEGEWPPCDLFWDDVPRGAVVVAHPTRSSVRDPAARSVLLFGGSICLGKAGALLGARLELSRLGADGRQADARPPAARVLAQLLPVLQDSFRAHSLPAADLCPRQLDRVVRAGLRVHSNVPAALRACRNGASLSRGVTSVSAGAPAALLWGPAWATHACRPGRCKFFSCAPTLVAPPLRIPPPPPGRLPAACPPVGPGAAGCGSSDPGPGAAGVAASLGPGGAARVQPSPPPRSAVPAAAAFDAMDTGGGCAEPGAAADAAAAAASLASAAEDAAIIDAMDKSPMAGLCQPSRTASPSPVSPVPSTPAAPAGPADSPGGLRLTSGHSSSKRRHAALSAGPSSSIVKPRRGLALPFGLAAPPPSTCVAMDLLPPVGCRRRADLTGNPKATLWVTFAAARDRLDPHVCTAGCSASRTTSLLGQLADHLSFPALGRDLGVVFEDNHSRGPTFVVKFAAFYSLVLSWGPYTVRPFPPAPPLPWPYHLRAPSQVDDVSDLLEGINHHGLIESSACGGLLLFRGQVGS